MNALASSPRYSCRAATRALGLAFLVLALGGCDSQVAEPDGGAAVDASMPDDGGPPAVDASVGDGGMRTEDAGQLAEDGGPSLDAAPADAGCPVAYAGPGCALCAHGYQDDDGRGPCRLGCDATGGDAIDCGVGAECALDDGVRYCSCFDGYQGDACDECVEGWRESPGGRCDLIPPPALGLMLWLDADDPDSLSVDSLDRVSEWRDTRGLPGLAATHLSLVTQPEYAPSYRNQRGGVVFDGVNDRLTVEDFDGMDTADMEVVVVSAPWVSGAMGLLGARTSTHDWVFLLDRLDASEFRATYRRFAGTEGGVDTSVIRDSPSTAQYVSVSHQSAGPIDTLAMFASDGLGESTDIQQFAQPSGPLPGPADLTLGLTQDASLTGAILEVLVYSRRLSVAERREVATYLRQKWNLR